MTFNECMVSERKRRHWNRQRVADKLGVHVNTIGRWETGDDVPLSMAIKWAQIFNIRFGMYFTV